MTKSTKVNMAPSHETQPGILGRIRDVFPRHAPPPVGRESVDRGARKTEFEYSTRWQELPEIPPELEQVSRHLLSWLPQEGWTHSATYERTDGGSQVAFVFSNPLLPTQDLAEMINIPKEELLGPIYYNATRFMIDPKRLGPFSTDGLVFLRKGLHRLTPEERQGLSERLYGSYYLNFVEFSHLQLVRGRLSRFSDLDFRDSPTDVVFKVHISDMVSRVRFEMDWRSEGLEERGLFEGFQENTQAILPGLLEQLAIKFKNIESGRQLSLDAGLIEAKRQKKPFIYEASAIEQLTRDVINNQRSGFAYLTSNNRQILFSQASDLHIENPLRELTPIIEFIQSDSLPDGSPRYLAGNLTQSDFQKRYYVTPEAWLLLENEWDHIRVSRGMIVRNENGEARMLEPEPGNIEQILLEDARSTLRD